MIRSVAPSGSRTVLAEWKSVPPSQPGDQGDVGTYQIRTGWSAMPLMGSYGLENVVACCRLVARQRLSAYLTPVYVLLLHLLPGTASA